jgi:hypothetical protein
MSLTPKQRPGSRFSSINTSSPKASSTPVRLSKLQQRILGVSSSATSSPGSGGGPSPCNSPESPPAPVCGPAPAPANLSPSPGKERESQTSGTSGLPSSPSSEPAILPSSSESKSPARQCSDLLQSRLNEVLEKRFSQCGSMEYSLTSKVQVTPAGRRIFRLRASALRTSVNVVGGEQSGWPTPTASSTAGAWVGRDGGLNLQTAAQMSGWPTPSSRDWKDTPGMATTGTNPDGSERTRLDQLPRVANLAGWATPRAEDSESSGMRHSRGVADTLTAQASVAGWPTPKERDHHPEASGQHSPSLGRKVKEVAGWATPITNDALGSQYCYGPKKPDGTRAVFLKLPGEAQLTHGEIPTGTPAGMANTEGFQLNPFFSMWLMSFPVEWTLAGILALKKFRSSQKPLKGSRSQTQKPSKSSPEALSDPDC